MLKGILSVFKMLCIYAPRYFKDTRDITWHESVVSCQTTDFQWHVMTYNNRIRRYIKGNNTAGKSP